LATSYEESINSAVASSTAAKIMPTQKIGEPMPSMPHIAAGI
jgi:hypothetical protein